MWNRYCQNHRSNLPNFLAFAWFDTPDFNRLPCSNNKMYDDAVFADQFRYRLTMFGIPVLIWLSRILHVNIAHEINTSKITAAFFRISYYLHDLIRLSSFLCHVQTKKMYDVAVFADRFRHQLTMFRIRILIGLSRLIHAHTAYEIDTAKIIATFFRICYL